MPVWKSNPDLMARLNTAQNHRGNSNRDIVTFAGFCDSREELERHVIANEQSCERHDAQMAEAG